MSKILKNQTGAGIFIADTGILLPASPGTYVIPPQDYLIWAASSDIVGPVGVIDVIVNDGSSDLTPSDGMDLIKGLFPNPVTLRGDTDGTSIGNVGDRLKVEADIAAGAGPLDVTETNPITQIRIEGATDSTLIGNVGDKLNVNVVPNEAQSLQQSVDQGELVCVLQNILEELKLHSFHLSQVTDVDNDGIVER